MSTEHQPDAHVVFDLVVDEDGWPPVSGERVWADHLGDDRYRINNVPFFVRNLAVNDVVRAVPDDENSHPVFRELLEPSDRVTVRLICYPDGPMGGDTERCMEQFTALGLYAEGAPRFGMVALDVAADAPIGDVVALLERGVAEDWWGYEEGRVTEAWLRAKSAD